MPRIGNDGPARHLERPLRIGPLDAQHHDRRADDDEREQRADAGHLAEDVWIGVRPATMATMTPVMIVVM